MSDFELKDGKFVINGLEDINRFIAERFPEGLEAHRKKDFFNNGAYIGFNLCRYAYSDELAAECHALRDSIKGIQGASYGFPFDPHVKRHTEESGATWYEVYTG